MCKSRKYNRLVLYCGSKRRRLLRGLLSYNPRKTAVLKHARSLQFFGKLEKLFFKLCTQCLTLETVKSNATHSSTCAIPFDAKWRTSYLQQNNIKLWDVAISFKKNIQSGTADAFRSEVVEAETKTASEVWIQNSKPQQQQ